MSHEAGPGRVREYRLTLEIEPDGQGFHGTVEIDVEGAGSSFTVNAVELQVTQARSGDGILGIEAIPDRGEVKLTGLAGEQATVVLDFNGRVVEKGLVGLYRSRFGEDTFLTSQCAATEARRIFPCVDRPDAKASIALDLTVGIDDGVVFNTPVVEQKTRGKRKRLKFDPTPPMSTYLFYLGVGPIEELRGRASRVRLSVVAPAGRSDEGQFAIDHTSRILPAYEEYFQIPYPLTKLDLVAVPELSYGAMENWGAITFREMRLLIDDTSTSAQRREALSTLTHEIAHQWFGNLVTMAWWDDIWLNESFATFMEPKMIGRLYPDSVALADFVLGWTAPALVGDSLPGTHPVRAPVENVEEISQIFDEISYGKGSAILRMMEAFLGEETFRKGVTAYLEKFKFGNARSEDLWAALEEAAGRPVRDVLDGWVGRPGLPVVAMRTEEGKVTLTQRRFSLIGGTETESPWPIPMVIESDGATNRVLFDTPTMEIPVVDVGSLHLNPAGLGFYRVLYDMPGYHHLRQRLDTMPPLHRWSVLQDLYAFLLAGEVGMDRYLDFVDAVGLSTDYASIVELSRQYLSAGFSREPPGLFGVLHAHERFQYRMRSCLTKQFERLGEAARESEPSTDGILRSLVARGLVWNDLDQARLLGTRFADWDAVEPDLAPAVAMGYARSGGADEYANLLTARDEAPDEAAELRIESALPTFRDPRLVTETLDLLGSGRINRGHVATVLFWGAMNPEGRESVWKWMVESSEPVLAQLRGTGYASEILERTLPFVGIGREEEVRRHFADHPWAEGDRGTRKGLDLLRATSRLAMSPP